MIDFSLLPRRNKTYAGANGSKIAVMYEDELYMLKFPGVARKNKDKRNGGTKRRDGLFRFGNPFTRDRRHPCKVHSGYFPPYRPERKTNPIIVRSKIPDCHTLRNYG